ncbi:MAG TPA: protein-export chaperone SecB [Rhodospirillaceae bacterium]|nr:protein-export chaperone SecB [Rhodospirillaceae bacterium]
MSETSPNSAEATGPAPVQISVHAQYVRDFSFESPNAPQIFAQGATPPALDMGVNVQTRNLEPHVFEVMLLLKLEAKVADKTAFIVELAYGGVFGLPEMPEEQVKLFLLVEAPRLLFPFARNIVAGAVRDGGFPQVLINPIDFAAMYMQQHGAMAQAPAGSA